MTDNSNLLNNRQGITSDCLYNMKASAVRSRSMHCSVLPTNKFVFAPCDVCVACMYFLREKINIFRLQPNICTHHGF